ncbi:MAG: hypothetical protein ACJAVV_003707 [Alphaproteobacteria bacterium]|jgi:hypothetical protein
MKYFLKFSLALAFVFFVSNDVLADDTYVLKNNYVSPNLELGDTYAVSAELGLAYSSVFNSSTASYELNTYYRENNGDFIFQGVFSLPESMRTNSLLIVDNYLLVLSETSVNFYTLGTSGQLSFFKTQDLSDQLPSGASLQGRVTSTGQGRYVLHSRDYMHLISIDVTNQLFSILDSVNPLNADENTVNTIIHLQYKMSNDSLWLVKNTDALYRFEQFDLSSQTFNSIEQHDYTFATEFDYVNEAGLLYAHHDDSSNGVVVQTNRRTFIFELSTNGESVNLPFSELRNNETFLAGSPSSDEQLIERDGTLYLTDIDWPNFQAVYNNTTVSNDYTNYDFINATDILGLNPFTGATELYNLQQGVFTATDTQFSSQLSDALPKRLIDSLYDPEASRILMLGSASSTVTQATLYIWQYDSQENTADFLASTLVLPAEIDGGFYNFHIVGTFGDYIYVDAMSNLTIQSEILVFQLLDGNLQLVQTFAWGGSSDIVINEFAFVAPNKIAFFPFIPPRNAYFIRVCNISEDGMISSCADKTILEGRLFQRASNSFKMTKLQNTEQLLLAPKQNISKDFEPDVSTWLLKYNHATDELNTLQTLENSSDEQAFFELDSGFTYAQGNKLSLTYGGNISALLEWNETSQQWDLTAIEPNTAFISAPMATAENSYFINDNGRPYLLDINTDSFYRGDQDRNLGNSNSTYQITSDNKGYVLDLDVASSLSTFEFVNTTPVQYKGGFESSSFEAIQDVPFEINFDRYFLNLDSNSIELFINGNESVEVLLPSITWDGKILSGTLNNEDMFIGEFSSQEASPISVRVLFGNSSLGTISIIPVNVNDAPVLTQEIETQNLQTNEAYEGSLGDIVVDPDRETIVYSYANIPSGMTGTEDGFIRGSITAAGNYTIRVTAVDPNGATLVFDINIVVTNVVPLPTPPPPPPSAGGSGGGSLSWFSILLMLICLKIRRGRANCTFSSVARNPQGFK